LLHIQNKELEQWRLRENDEHGRCGILTLLGIIESHYDRGHDDGTQSLGYFQSLAMEVISIAALWYQLTKEGSAAQTIGKVESEKSKV
jgi:hypothetical protein